MHWVFRSSDMHGSVVFNFQHCPVGDLSAFAHGYHDAAKRLVAEMERASGYCDFDGYPILFLYRHALELYMKAIGYRGAHLLRLLERPTVDIRNLFRHHRLSALVPGVRTVFRSLGWLDEFAVSGLSCFKDFDALIRGIEEVDPESYNFRYPVGTKAQGALPHHTVINVITFAKHMDPILDFLAGAVEGLQQEYDALAEAKHEIENVIKSISDECAGRDF